MMTDSRVGFELMDIDVESDHSLLVYTFLVNFERLLKQLSCWPTNVHRQAAYLNSGQSLFEQLKIKLFFGHFEKRIPKRS